MQAKYMLQPAATFSAIVFGEISKQKDTTTNAMICPMNSFLVNAAPLVTGFLT